MMVMKKVFHSGQTRSKCQPHRKENMKQLESVLEFLRNETDLKETSVDVESRAGLSTRENYEFKNDIISITFSDYDSFAMGGGSVKKCKVEVKKKNESEPADWEKRSFPDGRWDRESGFVWNFAKQKDESILLAKIKSIVKTQRGPFGISRRSTYVQNSSRKLVAKSGNFITEARVEDVVTLVNGKIMRNDKSEGDAWFKIKTNIGNILYNNDTELWWPVSVEGIYDDKDFITNSLCITGGKNLTKHDSFVLNLAIKIYLGEYEDDNA